MPVFIGIPRKWYIIKLSFSLLCTLYQAVVYQNLPIIGSIPYRCSPNIDRLPNQGQNKPNLTEEQGIAVRDNQTDKVLADYSLFVNKSGNYLTQSVRQ